MIHCKINNYYLGPGVKILGNLGTSIFLFLNFLCKEANALKVIVGTVPSFTE